MTPRFPLIVLASALLLVPTRAADPPSFTVIVGPDGSNADFDVFAVSGDGSVVCGTSYGSGIKAFRWTAAGGSEFLGDLGGVTPQSSAHGISADGTTIVGWSTSPNGPEAFRWTAATGMQGLGDLPGGPFNSEARAVSADGSVIVGRSISDISVPGGEGFRWSQATGMKSLGDLPGSTVFSLASAVSANGTRIVGYGTSPETGPDGFASTLWAWPAEPVYIGDLVGGGVHGKATGISANGHVIVGDSKGALGTTMAYRWADLFAGGTGMQQLGTPSTMSRARGVSADGNVIVGWHAPGQDSAAWVWTAGTGIVDLDDLLASLGVDHTGMTLADAVAISADGRTIVGDGQNTTNLAMQGWVVHLGDAWTALGRGVAGVAGVPELEVHGTLLEGHPLIMELTGGKPAGSAALVVGLSELNAPFKGGTLVPNPDTLFTGLPLNGSGGLALASAWPAGLPSGFSIWLQAWIADAVAVQGFSASNGVEGTQP